jgi:hypothetical protein
MKLMSVSVSVVFHVVFLTAMQFVEPETRDITQAIWNVLKTLLFSTIMITDAALSNLVFVPPKSHSLYKAKNSLPRSPVLAARVLHTLSRLSFIISQFGGVTTTSTSGFMELKKVFYLSIDILGVDPVESEKIVRDLSTGVYVGLEEMKCIYFFLGLQQEKNDSFGLAKKAYALATIEQLVPVLSDECILQYAIPLCLPSVPSSIASSSTRLNYFSPSQTPLRCCSSRDV